jgi:hypothetical protein
VKLAQSVLAHPDATEEEKTAAREALKVIPECLAIEEKEGSRYLRVK